MDPINRRSFLGGVGLTASGAMGGLPVLAEAPQCASGPQRAIVKQPLDVKLNVKQAYAAWIYEGVWEGPCRWDVKALPDLSRAEQLEILRKQFREVTGGNRKLFDSYINVMTPAFLDYYMPNEFGEQQLKLLAPDAKDVDVYLVCGNKHPQHPTCLIGERFGKPAMLMGWGRGEMSVDTGTGVQNSRDVAAFFRSRGIPGYGPLTMGGVLDVLRLIWAKKAFQNIKLLYITNRAGRVGRISMSNVHNWEDIQQRYGVCMQIVTYAELEKEIDRIRSDKEMQGQSRKLADQLMRKAQDNRIAAAEVAKSVDYYLAVRHLMDKYDCTAHTIECYEFCESKLPQKWRVTPCLSHVLLNDQGCPSACEGDLNALFAAAMLMYASRRATHIGNLYYRGDDAVYMGHNVPPRRLLGFEQPEVPYALQNFVLSGWGAKVQIDYSKLPEKTATFARTDPLLSRILIVKGEITHCIGHDKPGCSLQVHCTVPDTQALHEKAQDYGFHFAMAVGDHAEDVGRLAEMLGMKSVFHNA